MKKILAILSLFFVLSSCSIKEDEPNFHTVILPITAVELPQEFILGETYQIKVWYNKPSTCHTFSGIYYDKYLNERIVAVTNIVTEGNNCQNLSDSTVDSTFDFYVTSNGSYIFKFWQGEDGNGQDIFYEVEVPVID